MKRPVRKFAFYAKSQEVIDELEKVPPRQMSLRLSELAKKGLEFEKQEQLKKSYSEYALKLSEEEHEENSKDNQILSKSLFEDKENLALNMKRSEMVQHIYEDLLTKLDHYKFDEGSDVWADYVANELLDMIEGFGMSYKWETEDD